MIATEKEARGKWCPMVRYAQSTGDENSSNRWESRDSDDPVENPDECRCIASDCAMWRWAVFAAISERPPTTMLNTNPHAPEVEVVAENPNEARGYCGLAGLPVVLK